MKVIIFVFSMMLSLAAYSAVEIDGIYYNLNSITQTAEVTRNSNVMGTYYGRVDIWIPSSISYNGVDYRVTGIGAWAFENSVQLTTITIPESVTYIEESAFYNCSSLTSLTIPNKVHSIYDDAFWGCSKLATIIIPKSVTSIGKGVFQRCDALESIVVEEGNPRYDSRNNCNAIIWDKSLVAGCKNTIIPDGISSIWTNAFMYCNGLSTIDIPEGVTAIESGAFQGCSNLSSVTLPSSLETIHDFAFADCPNLESVTIPSNVKTIGDGVFRYCQLKTVTSLIDNPFPISNDVFTNDNNYSISENTDLYVPKGAKSKYENTKGWNYFKSIVEITQKCKTPIISYSNGQLTFECETEDVEFKTIITDTDIKAYSESVIDLSATYYIRVFATKPGYDNSEMTTATLCWIDAEPKTEGIENNVAQVRANAVLIQSHDGTLNISGVADGTDIMVYSVSGQMVGSSKARGDRSTIATSFHRGEVAIVRIGEKSVKVVIQ